jgi:hypothetical protein
MYKVALVDTIKIDMNPLQSSDEQVFFRDRVIHPFFIKREANSEHTRVPSTLRRGARVTGEGLQTAQPKANYRNTPGSD